MIYDQDSSGGGGGEVDRGALSTNLSSFTFD